MFKKKILIISCLPLKPVKSGFQNTNYLLFKFLKKYHRVNFISINNKNRVDPIINLKINKSFFNQIDKINPNIIFITTTKLFFYLNNFLKNKKIKPIIICHDLYNFRKKFFKKIKIKDKNSISKYQELKLIRESNFIFDFSKKEEKYLLENNIPKKKLIYTNTPIEIEKNLYKYKKKYDFIFSGSNWVQNKLNLKSLFKNKNNFYNDKKIIIMGADRIKKKFVNSVNFNKKLYLESKVGLAPINHKYGRNVKIFEMLSYGLPVFTNIDLSNYGLKDKTHYFLVKKNNWDLIINKFFYKKKFLDFVGKNARKWSVQNSDSKKCFKIILKKINK
jgi:hypothetical protein|tara:strand:- start:879 stop:1874 length:996 start_codon:yes stop_codon:yes gene_type:complete